MPVLCSANMSDARCVHKLPSHCKNTFALGCARPDSYARSCRAECELPWLSCHLTSPALFALYCACAETWEPSNTSTVLADCVQRPCKPELQAELVVHSAVSASIVCQVGRMQAVAASPEGAVNGYAIGSYLYLGIVFMLPMGLGLGGLALDLPVGHFTSTINPVNVCDLQFVASRVQGPAILHVSAFLANLNEGQHRRTHQRLNWLAMLEQTTVIQFKVLTLFTLTGADVAGCVPPDQHQ